MGKGSRALEDLETCFWNGGDRFSSPLHPFTVRWEAWFHNCQEVDDAIFAFDL